MKKLLKKDAFTYYSILSICLWVVIVSLYMWWPIAGKAPVELWDGQSQHFVSFVYFGEYIREIIKNILIDHNFSILFSRRYTQAPNIAMVDKSSD